jgi:hypothetical protein
VTAPTPEPCFVCGGSRYDAFPDNPLVITPCAECDGTGIAPTPDTPAAAWPSEAGVALCVALSWAYDDRDDPTALSSVAKRVLEHLGPRGWALVREDEVTAREAAAERRGAEKELRAAAACLDNDDEVAVWLRNRADFVAGPDTTPEGDPS